MRKQELVHLHGLLLIVRRHVDEQGNVEIPEGTFDTYDDYGIRPTAISERKKAHKEAVDLLAGGLQTALERQRSTVDRRQRSALSSEASAQ